MRPPAPIPSLVPVVGDGTIQNKQLNVRTTDCIWTPGGAVAADLGYCHVNCKKSLIQSQLSTEYSHLSKTTANSFPHQPSRTRFAAASYGSAYKGHSHNSEKLQTSKKLEKREERRNGERSVSQFC